MPDVFATRVAVLALAIAATTAWLTFFRRGSVRMTRPTVIFFGPDASGRSDDPPLAEVFLRTLLVANWKRGRVVESMHVAVQRSDWRRDTPVRTTSSPVTTGSTSLRCDSGTARRNCGSHKNWKSRQPWRRNLKAATPVVTGTGTCDRSAMPVSLGVGARRQPRSCVASGARWDGYWGCRGKRLSFSGPGETFARNDFGLHLDALIPANLQGWGVHRLMR